MWWLEVLFVLTLAMGWFPCCCGGVVGTRSCIRCAAGIAPDEYQVVISGAADNACSGCAVWNGTWIIPYVSDCRYDLQDPFSTQINHFGCESTTRTGIGVFLNASSISINLTMVGQLPAPRTGTATYFKSLGLLYDCDGITNESYPFSFAGNDYGGSTNECNWSSISVELTALP